jgi:hypothetical protein
MMIVSLSPWLLARWTIQELSLVYGEFLGGAGLPAIAEVLLHSGHWAFLGHAMMVILVWMLLLRYRCEAQVAHLLLFGFALALTGLVVVMWMGTVLPLFTITWRLGAAG